MARPNLSSPNTLLAPRALDDLERWFEYETTQVSNAAERRLLSLVGVDLDSFVSWPKEALLLWPGV